jgi:hypothetical protein
MPEHRLTGDDDAFAALVLRFLDGATTTEEDAILNAELGDPRNDARRELYVALCRQRGQMREALAPNRAVRRFAPWKILLVTAAILALGLSGYLFFIPESPVAIAVVERVEGRVTRSDGAAVAAGDGLSAGQGLETNGKGRAVFRFQDGTHIDLAAQTQVRGLEANGGKQFFVVRGTVAADVVKQPSHQPMAVRTADGEARVLGTQFTVWAKPGSTRVEVEKGIVRLTRLSDKNSADLTAGQFAVASANEDLRARSVALERIRALAPNTWQSIPGTAMLRVAPDAASFPAIQGQMGASAVVAAWSGAALDSKRDRLVLWGGGHTDYFGNELYAFDVGTMAWERLTDPTRDPNLNGDANRDGTPNGRATYNGLAYHAGADQLFSLGGSLAGGSGATGTVPWTFGFDTKKWTRRSPSGPAPAAGYGAACSYDPATRRIWWADTSGLFSYALDADRWIKHDSGGEQFYYMTGAIDTKRGLWLLVGGGKLFAFDIRGALPIAQAWKAAGGDDFVKRPNPGLDYDPVRDRMLGWAGGAVYRLDPETKTISAAEAPGAPAATPNGIFGRWRYVPSVDAFILVTSASEEVRFYKPRR